MRQRTTFYHVSLVAAALATAALGACKKSNEYANNDTSALRTDSAAGRTDTMAGNATHMDSGTTTGKYANASVLAYMVQANNGEITLGKLGERMATNPQVKAFAHMLVADHQKMLSSANQLGKKVSAIPDTS